jgi:hypothetical protein
MSKASFLSLYNILKGDEIFQNNDDRRRGRKQPRDIVSREYLSLVNGNKLRTRYIIIHNPTEINISKSIINIFH